MCCFQFHCSPSRNELMSHKYYPPRTSLCTSKLRHVVTLAVVAFSAMHANQSAAQPPVIELTQVGSPIWRPTGFQVFSAPDNDTTRALLRGPNDPPPDATTYTTPHAPPYDNELST